MKRKKNILLAVFVVFCAFQLFFITKRIHNYPFMIYDMYSRPEYKKQTSYHYLIIADGDTVDLTSLPIMEEGRLIKNLSIYSQHKRPGNDYWSPALTSRQDRWTNGVFKNSRLRSRSDRLLRNSETNVQEFEYWLKEIIEHRTGCDDIYHLEVQQAAYSMELDSILYHHDIIDSYFTE